jgi:peptidoglycan/xylan/chitin deacetylase (PgdA/CDA1 family)
LYLKNIPRALSLLFKDINIYVKDSDSFYLTFDDGPFPTTTPLILEKLKKLNVKATFFCTGKQAEKHIDLLDMIIAHGHIVGNHGHCHLNGWKTSIEEYVSNINRSKQRLKSNLFRPPYGKLTWKQYQKLKTNNKIVLWDNMPGDFDKSLSQSQVISNFKRNLKSGTIVVLHDNPQSISKCLAILDFISSEEINSLKFDTLNCLL